ncbi:HAD family hydrolase [Lactobacillus apis]|uniref:HAD family hydrolase n=1 Tax=Lactobacillus apis TaxID=303541 RepID=A0A0F4LTH7_9LACO|nr:HAD hydrolase-like protein [Lactobacillus apis]KJY60886.1 uncharacterized protein JF72_10470 [Lactobacillus apis]
MTKYQTLIFVPEGSLLNEKTAEQVALRQTLKELGHDFGPAERLKYSSLQGQVKMMGFSERIALTLQNFCADDLAEAEKIFKTKLGSQRQLVKDAIPFLDQVTSQVKLILLAKEERELISARLSDSELLNYFSASYFKEDFTNPLPNKNVLFQIIKEQELDPDNCLVIGTDLVEEIQGAENAGLQSLWIAPKKVKMPISPRPTLHLTKLSDLLFYLELN